MDLNVARRTIRERGWLRSRPGGFADRLLAGARLRGLQAGETLCHMSDPSNGLIGLADGTISVFLDARPGIMQLAFVAHPGYWGGTIGVADGVPRRATLMARTAVTLLFVPLSHVEALAREDGETWRHVAVSAAGHFDNLGLLMLAHLHRDNRVRVLITLRRLNMFNDGVTRFRISQSELAEMAGMSRNMVNRALRQLAADGLVETGYGMLQLVDPDGIVAALHRAHLPAWRIVPHAGLDHAIRDPERVQERPGPQGAFS